MSTSVPALSRGPVALPGERVIVRNGDDRRRRVRVVRHRGGGTRSDAVALAPGEGERLPVPDGSGRVHVDVFGDGVSASTTVTPGTQPALFTVVGDSVVVVRD